MADQSAKITAQMTDEQHADFMAEVRAHHARIESMTYKQGLAAARAAKAAVDMQDYTMHPARLRDTFAAQALAVGVYEHLTDAEAAARAYTLADAMLAARAFQATHRHVKRGTEYREAARGKLQTDVPLTDYAELVAYHDAEGNWWFRAPAEFDDGRFEAVR